MGGGRIYYKDIKQDWSICEYWRQDTLWCAKPKDIPCTHFGSCNGRNTESQTSLFGD